MADQTQMARSHEMSQCQSQSQSQGQAQATRLDEAVMSGKGCEPQENMQRGMGHGDSLMEGVGSDESSARNSGPAAAGSGGGGGGGNNNNSNTYQYSNHSLI